MKDYITKEELISHLDKSKNSTLAKKYIAWSKLDNDDQGRLYFLGKLVVDEKHNKEFISSESYWSPNYPIALEYYPYDGCEIYTDGSDYFFIYQEFGGHAPEKRCRSIRKELILGKP